MADEQNIKENAEAGEAGETPEISEMGAYGNSLFAGNLVYPLENQDRYGASLTIIPYKIVPPSLNQSLGEQLKGSLSTGVVDAASVSQEDNLDKLFSGDLIRTAISGLSKVVMGTLQGVEEATGVGAASAVEEAAAEASNAPPPTARQTIPRGGKVKMYLPAGVTFNDGFQYDTPSLGRMGEAGLNAISSGGGALSAIGAMYDDGRKSVTDLFGKVGNQDLARAALARGADKLGAVGSSAASIGLAVTLNPNVRSAFKGVTLREFTFSFKFLPKSKEEAKAVEKIIDRFRFSAYPESIQAGAVSVGYNFPDLFEIILEANGRQLGPKFQKCYLRAISTNYNPTTMTFFEDGRPTEIDLTLNFVEEKTIDRGSVMEGY